MSIGKSSALRMHRQPAPISINFPGRHTVVMVCREKDGDIRLAYQKIQNYLKEQALQLSSDLYSLSIVNVIDPNAERKYLKYIIACVEPVKSMSERHRGLKITRK